VNARNVEAGLHAISRGSVAVPTGVVTESSTGILPASIWPASREACKTPRVHSTCSSGQKPSTHAVTCKTWNGRDFDSPKASPDSCISWHNLFIMTRLVRINWIPVGHQIFIERIHLLHVITCNLEVADLTIRGDPFLGDALRKRDITML